MPAVAGRTFPLASVLRRDEVIAVIAKEVVVALVVSNVGSVDVAVVVAKMLPTVNCVPVAMRTPEPFVVTTELIGSAASEDRGTPETVKAPPDRARPEPKRLLNELPLTMRFVVEAVANDE